MFKIDNENNNGQTNTEGEPVVELPTTEEPAEQVVGELPDSAKEQTKQEFEKLKEHNKQLSEKLAQFEQQQPKFNSVLDEMPVQAPNFSNLSPAQVQDITQGLVDENGYIDQGLLNKTLTDANVRAQRAEDRAMLAERRIEKFEETQLVRDVHAKYPTLDPYNSNFNREFYDKVKGEIQGQLRKGYQDFQAAADKVAAELKAQSKDSETQQKAKEEEQKKVISQREQASTVGAGKSSQTSSYEDLEEGTRKGDNLSIGQRLQNSGY
ncbi:MAG: hypothetical protein M0P59_13430 [Gallionella sp.]|nr:hypothetical protein [Gallionella sp.]